MIKIAVLTDLHFSRSRSADHPDIRGEIGETLLLRAVNRLNRYIHPDIALVLGDLLEDGEATDTPELRKQLRKILDRLKMPWVIIPGNHDGEVRDFYSDFPCPPEFMDLKGVRFVPFIDLEEPERNARRTERGLELMAKARAGFDGPLVALHHVPLFPPDGKYLVIGDDGKPIADHSSPPSPYNYSNADEVIARMRRYGYILSLSGHFHAGMGHLEAQGMHFIGARSIAESPFPFLIVELDEGKVATQRHNLKLPEGLRLVDSHVHTQFAYCSENMTVAGALSIARDFGLAGVGFSEHGSHLYYDSVRYAETCLYEGIEGARPEDERFGAYLKALADAGAPPESVGLEIDHDFHHKLLLMPGDKERVNYLIGAVHRIPELQNPNPDIDKACDEFLAAVKRILDEGVQVLAHPFRIFRRRKLEKPARLFEPVARMILEHGAAAEINFHTNEPSREFFQVCLEMSVPISFGGDAHNLYEVGEFYPHLQFLKSCGFDGDIWDVLVDPRKR